jgi:hypothetical protein
MYNDGGSMRSKSRVLTFNLKVPSMTSRNPKSGRSKLANFVLDRLPDDYMLTDNDLRWLDLCDRHLFGAPTEESVLMATKAAFEVEPRFHVDPFELLIDAEICDTKCELLR